ncbi:MAG: divalent-cation tolerance protein CutA [Microthrixaceae bacterium]
MNGEVPERQGERSWSGASGPEVAQVVTVVDDEEAAVALADAAVGCHLAACAQVEGPVRSVYRWEGELRSDLEWRVVAKTTPGASRELVELWGERHPYEVPEILVVAVTDGHRGYLDWVAGEVRPGAGGGV